MRYNRFDIIRRLFFTCVLMVFGLFVKAQVFEIPKDKAIDIKVGELVYKFHVLIKKTDVEIDNSIYYNWFKDGKLYENQGGYSGQLLEGIYSVYSFSGKLLERGQYSHGIKEGEWKKWDASGKLIQLSHWRDGLKHGMFIDYSTGVEVSRKYKNGKIKEKKKFRLRYLFGLGRKKFVDEKEA